MIDFFFLFCYFTCRLPTFYYMTSNKTDSFCFYTFFIECFKIQFSCFNFQLNEQIKLSCDCSVSLLDEGSFNHRYFPYFMTFLSLSLAAKIVSHC